MLSLLGCYALGAVLLSGDHIGVTAWPKPANSEHHVHERRAITLGETSSCNDVSNYQEENGISHIEADMYNDLNANTTLATWVVENTWGSGNLEINGFVSKFAAP